MVTKAPQGWILHLEKAWGEDGQDCFYEGWLSTPNRDLEKDITEPEAFVPVLKSYFARRAPVTVQHGTQYLPAGHLQKAVVVRDGKVLATQNIQPMLPNLSISPAQVQVSGSEADLRRALLVIQSVRATAVE